MFASNQLCFSDSSVHSRSIVTPSDTSPQPMSRQCFSTRRLRAIFSPTRVQTGESNLIFATLTSPLPSPKSLFVRFFTCAPQLVLPMLTCTATAETD